MGDLSGVVLGSLTVGWVFGVCCGVLAGLPSGARVWFVRWAGGDWTVFSACGLSPTRAKRLIERVTVRGEEPTNAD